MFFHRCICVLLSTTLFLQSVAPTLAMQADSIDKLDKQLEGLRGDYSSVPAPLSFKAQPGQTGAGTLLYADHQGESYILLGLRNNQVNTKLGNWCNCGGNSDVNEEFLAHTASRETKEESNLYCLHPRLLKNQPFIDTYDGSLLYRMYWQQVPYLNEAEFRKRLENAAAVNREFTDFIWVKARDLLDAVNSRQPFIRMNQQEEKESKGKGKEKETEKTITVYPEFFSTLSTDSGKAFLHSLVTHRKINRFNKNLRPLINRLYLTESEKLTLTNLHPMPSLNWPPITVDSVSESLKAQERAHENMRRSPLPICPVNEEEKATYLAQRTDFLAQKDTLADVVFEANAYEKVAFDGKNDKSILAGSVAAHLGSLIELKKGFLQKDKSTNDQINKNEKIEDQDELEDSLSNMSLKIILGPDYKTPDHFPGAIDPQDAADTVNIDIFLERYYETDESANAQERKEFRRSNFKALPTDRTLIKSILQKERRNKTWPTFYHATSDNLYNFILSITHLREYMMAIPLKGTPGLRGTDMPFKAVKTMGDAVQKYGYQDYSERQNIVLCANFTALAGLLTTRTSSSSLEYVMTNHSVRPPELSLTMQEALALAGFENPTNQYFESLFQQFIAINNNEYPNSVMLAIQLHPALLQDYTYPAFGGGRPFCLQGQSDTEHLTTADVVDGVREEYNRQKDSPESFEQDKERKKNLIPEARLLMHPKIMFNHDKVRVTSFPRFSMSLELQGLYNQEMHFTTLAMIADWLEQENCILEGSFDQYPVAKKLYNRVHSGITGNPVQEKVSFEGLFHLVQHGHVEAVQGYISNYPNILEDPDSIRNRLILAALKSNSPEMVKLVLFHLKERLQINMSGKNMINLFRVAQDSSWNQSAAFIYQYLKDNKLLESSDFFIPVMYLLLQPQLNIFGLPNSNDLEKRLTLMHTLGASSDKPDWLKDIVIEHLFTTTLADPMVKNLVCSKILFPHEIISPHDMLMALHKKLSAPETRGAITQFGLSYQREFINLLKQEEQQQALFEIGASGGNPFIFNFAEWQNPLCTDMLRYLKEQSKIFEVRNTDKLGLLAAMQKAHLAGFPAGPLPSLMTLYKEMGRNLNKESYNPFFQLYGTHYKEENALLNQPDVFVFSQNRAWAMSLVDARSPRDVSKLLETCPDARLLKKLNHKIQPLLLSQIIKKKSNFYNNKANDWIDALKEALKKEALKREQQKSKSEHSGGLLHDSNEDSLDFLHSGSGNRFYQLMVSQQSIMKEQFPDIFILPYEKKSKDEKNPDLSEFLSDIPETIPSIKNILRHICNSKLADFFKSSQQFSQISHLLKERKKTLSEQRNQWLNELKALVDNKEEEHKIYSHVENMPPLLKEQYYQVFDLVKPYFYKIEESIRHVSLHDIKKEEEETWVKRVKHLLTQPTEIESTQLQDLIEKGPSAAAFRKVLHLFLKKSTVAYLPRVLAGGYACAADFARDNEFNQERNNNTYRHPFPYALMGQEPALMVKELLPYLDPQDAPRLLKFFDNQSFWTLIKTNKLGDVKTLVTLIPWMFQQRTENKDFFLQSIHRLSKNALRHLVMESLNHLKTTEWKRCLPYFVYLMMDGGNESIVQQAIKKDPSLLEIESLDGLTMEDFLTFYASPPIVKVIRDFQKGEKKS